MRLYVRDQQAAELDFKDILPDQEWNLQQFQAQYAPGIYYFELVNFHLMLCVDLELCQVIEVCTDLDIEDVSYYVYRYEKAKQKSILPPV